MQPDLIQHDRGDSIFGLLLARVYEFDERSRFVAGLVLLVTASLHALILTPFTETTRQRAAANAELALIEAPLAEVELLETSIRGSQEAVTSAVAPALERLVIDLEADLRRVAATRRLMRRMMEEETPTEVSRGEATEETNAADDASEPFQVDNVDWIFDIGRASGRDELLVALAPLVDSRVTSPRFGALEERWAATVLPRVEAHLDHLAGAVPRLRGLLPAQSAALDDLAAAIGAQRRAARDLRFKPPEQPAWWTSAPLSSEDSQAGEGLSLRLDPAIAAQIHEPLELDQLAVTAAGTAKAWRHLLSGLEARQAALATGVGATGSPRRSWESAAPFFPLLLGLLFALLLLFRTERTRELGLLVIGWTSRATRAKAAAPRDWFFVRSGGATRRSFVLRAVIAGFLGGAWISLVAAQLRPLAEREAFAAAAGGITIFWIVLGYSFLVRRQIRARLVPRTSAAGDLESSAEPDEDVRDGDGLDGHPLR